MAMMRRVVVTAGACAVLGGGALMAAPVASAFTLTPLPGGASLTTNQAEAAAIHNAHVGPLVDAVLPGQRGKRTGLTAGQLVELYSGQAARTPGSTFNARVTGYPTDTSFYVGYRFPRTTR